MIAVRVFALDLPSRVQGIHDRVDRALIRSSYGFVPETPYIKLSMYSLGKVSLLFRTYLGQIRPPNREILSKSFVNDAVRAKRTFSHCLH